MDSNFWTTRLAAAKRQYTLQNNNQSSHLDGLSIDDYEVVEDEEVVRNNDYPCPYCYENFDIVSLCSHLEDDHSCDSQLTVCPICSIKVTRDLLSHITLQHGQLFKMSFDMKLASRRRRLRRVAVPSQTMSLMGRDLREAHLQVLLGGGGYRSSSANASNVCTDPFLSSLILNFPTIAEAEEISKSVISSVEDSSISSLAQPNSRIISFDPSLSYEERQRKMRQAAGRADFVQDLLFSTLADN